MSNQFERLRCIERINETADTATFVFEKRDDSEFDYKAGQFLTFEINVQHVMEYRAYSFSSSPANPKTASITIKRAPGGKVSNYLLDHLDAGFSLPASAPAGKFTLQDNLTSDDFVLMSAGSGITPCLSIARWLLDTKQTVNIHFIHSARREDDVIMATLLDDLAAQHDNFTLTRVLETSNNSKDLTGRIDKAMFEGLIPEVQGKTIFICGPSLYMKSVFDIASDSGFNMDYFHQESFVPETEGDVVFSDVNYEVNMTNEGKQFLVNENQVLLDAIQSAGIRIPYSCKSGICGACKCKVTGNVNSSSSEALTEDEIKQGYILACSAKATSDISIEL